MYNLRKCLYFLCTQLPVCDGQETGAREDVSGHTQLDKLENTQQVGSNEVIQAWSAVTHV